MDIKQELKNQDPRGTADPIYCVYEKYEQVVPEDCGEDGHKWYYDCETYTDQEIIDNYKENEEELDLDDLQYEEELNPNERVCYQKYYYKMLPKFVSPFFTEKAAQEFIDRNKHNLSNPYIYVHSLWNNSEMKSIRDNLLK